jgi:hypothetical protein
MFAVPTLSRALFVGAGIAVLSGPLAIAAPPGQAATARAQNCFFINEWRGWKAPSPDVIYLSVNMHDVYRVELSAGSPELQWPNAHLVSESRGGDSVCDALDLDLSVSDGHGFREPLIARSIDKLTPAEVAAIPPKFRP